MRIGVVGVLPAPVDRIDAAAIDRVVALGFLGVGLMLGTPGAIGPAHLERARQDLAAAGVAVAQANGSYPSLIDRDPAVRAAGVEGLIEHMASAAVLGAETLYVRPGGLDPEGPWWPHPEHHRREPFERLVESLARAADAAASAGIALAVEGHVLSVLDTPERVCELFARVGSDALRFNLDPVNFIGNVRDAWCPQPVFDRLLGLLGPSVVTAHWKDYTVERRLVLHISEVAPGDGIVDHVRWLRELEVARPDAWVLIEHLPPARIPAAKAALDAAMRAAGLAWDATR